MSEGAVDECELLSRNERLENALLDDDDENDDDFVEPHIRSSATSSWSIWRLLVVGGLLLLLVSCTAIASALLTKLWLQRHGYAAPSALEAAPYYDYGTVPRPLLRTMEHLVRTHKPRTLRYACRQFCGGLSDRLRGVQALAYLAALTDRQLVLDASLLSRRPADALQEAVTYMQHIDNCTMLVSDLLAAPQDHVEVETNCWVEPRPWAGNATAHMAHGFPPPTEFPHTRIPWSSIAAAAEQQADSAVACDMGAFDNLAQYCAAYHDCGVLALMLSRVADEPLTVASHMVDGATAALGSEYTGLHVRCGGSVIPVAACNVSAVSYYDGLKGDIPRLLLAHMRTLRESGRIYRGAVAVASDSARFKGELAAIMGGSAPGLLGCCFPPRHVDRDKALATAPLQELIDLLLLGRSARILSTSGAYSALASVFTRFSTAPTPLARLVAGPAAEALTADSTAALMAALDP